MLFSEELLEIWGQPHWGHHWPLAGSQRLEASGLQPLIECYWKIACLRHAIFRGTPGNLRAASLRSLLTSGLLFGGSKCLSSRKKVSVLHLSVCSFGDQSSQLILCLDRMYIFLNLDCPALVWLSSRGRTIRPWLDSPDLGKWKFSRDKETLLSSFIISEQSFKYSNRTFIQSSFLHAFLIWLHYLRMWLLQTCQASP